MKLKILLLAFILLNISIAFCNDYSKKSTKRKTKNSKCKCSKNKKKFRKNEKKIGQPNNACYNAFQKKALQLHNAYRAKHGSPQMTISNAANNFAKKYANELLRSGKFEHSKGSGFGENLYTFSSSNRIPDSPRDCEKYAENAVKSWYDEIKFYNYNNPVFSFKTGHFTQVVWKKSTGLGVGLAIGKNKAIVTANYAPAGNVQGQFRENVPRLRSG